jgi:hypothetical protein
MDPEINIGAVLALEERIKQSSRDASNLNALEIRC